MGSEKDIFEKMDALVRKHHPAPAQPSAILPIAKPASPTIPTLTEVIPDPSLDKELEHDLIPLLTEAILPASEQAAPSLVELDLDPFFTITAPELPQPETGKKSLPIPPAVPRKPDAFTFPELEKAPTEAPAQPETTPAHMPEPAQESVPAGSLLSAEALSQFSDTLSEQLMRALDQRLQQAVDRQIAPQLAQSVDKALSSMLDQFSVNIEYMVRESITQELQRQLSALLHSPDSTPAPTPSSNSSTQADDSV